MRQTLRTIDAHVGGQPVRLIVDGVPPLAGRTMASKRESLTRQADYVRRMAVLEPRGHADMCAAMLTEPVTTGSNAGLLFLQRDGFIALSGHSVVGAATIAIERGLVLASGESLTFDTEAGPVQVRARVQPRGEATRVDSVVFTGVPSFVLDAGRPLRLGSRDLRVDVAFGGVFYAIVDTEAVGVPLDVTRLPDLMRIAMEIRDAVKSGFAHPADQQTSALGGVMFTGAPNDPEAHLRGVTIFAGGSVDRSPCATGTAALMAVLDAMGLLGASDTFVHESITGSLHRGRIAGRTMLGEVPAIVPEIEATAWITGEHTLLADEDDPFRHGFDLARPESV